MSIKVVNSQYSGDFNFSGYPFELSNFQKHSIHDLENGSNILVCAPTGSGKTLIAEHVIKKYSKLTNTYKKKVIYTSPIKALSNCLFNEFTNKYKDISFGILTGDIKYNPDADCVIMTTEILRNLLYNKKIKSNKIDLDIEIDIYRDVAAIIFDEIHYIGDKHRGRVWEESLILIPPEIKIIMLSATIENPKVFGQWVQDIKNTPLTLSYETKRVVPLKHYIYTSFLPKTKNIKKDDLIEFSKKYNNKLIEILDHRGKFNTANYESISRLKKNYSRYLSKKSLFNDLASFLRDSKLLPSIIFTLSRKKCELYSKNINIILNDSEEQSLVEHVLDTQLRKSSNYDQIIKLEEYHTIKKLLIKGIAYHHSGVYHIFKESIEMLLGYKDKEGKRKPLVKLLFATETFAVGVNMPTKAVCYSGITKFSESGFRYLLPHEYNQMSGRAGRRGIDKEGIAILLPNLYDLPNVHDLKNMMCGKHQVIRSKFIPNFQFLLKIIQVGNNNILDFVKKSLLDSEIIKENNHLNKLIDEIVLPEIDFDELIRYEKLKNCNKNNGLYSLSKKTIKKNMVLAEKIKNSIIDFDKKLKIYKSYKNKIKEKKDLIDQLENNTLYIHNFIVKILSFLQINGYILKDIDLENYNDLTHQSITTKGLIASQINECNELLFTEIINSEFINDLNAEEIAMVFSIFIEQKNNDYQMTLNSLNLDRKFYTAFKNIVDIVDNFYYKIEKKNLFLDIDWNIYFEMVNPVYDWIHGCSLDYITKTYDIYSGTFVKNIIKLNNIIQDVVKMAPILNKLKLFENASKIQSLLIKGNINTDSLYVKF